ncbi:MAG: T9SS type A sorting domain-containing protein [bacterium]|nr:T9SS type A sorting domain-containing protein [bacterium]
MSKGLITRFAVLAVVQVLAFMSAVAELRRVPQDYSNIQAAVESTLPGDTVLLSAGTYREAVTVPARDMTIASEYVLNGDTAEIAQCIWMSTVIEGDSLRCLTIADILEIEPTIVIQGIRFALARIEGGDMGGAILVEHCNARVEDCRFDSCQAGSGGAVAVLSTRAELNRCRFTYCGAGYFAGIVYADSSHVLVDSCLVQSCATNGDSSTVPDLFGIRTSNLTVRHTEFTECGHGAGGSGAHFVNVWLPRDTVRIVQCEFFNNRWDNLINWGGEFLNYLLIDSCHFHDELLAQALYSQGLPDCTVTLQVTDNEFERFSYELPYVMHGLFALDQSHAHTLISRNLISEFPLGHSTLGSLFGRNFAEREISRNYVVNNSNWSHFGPPDKQFFFFVNADTGEFEHNIFLNNRGYSIYQAPPWTGAHARHNYFGHETGPYDSVNNPGGEGDTIWWAVDYVPWEPDSDFTSPVNERHSAPVVTNSFIGNSYPNPFNGEVTIEFVLLQDQRVDLAIVDLSGRHVASVLSGQVRKGVHIRTWRPEHSASGIYFARLVADGAVSCSKLLYLR